MKRSLVVLSLVSLVLAGVASAEVKRGDVFLDFAAGWTQVSRTAGAADDNTYYGWLRPGYALTDNVRIAAVGGVSYDDSATGKTTAWDFGVSGEYVFMPANQLNPYVGALIEWTSSKWDPDAGNSSTTDGWKWGPRVGALFTLNRANNLFGEFQYFMYEGDIRKDGGPEKEFAIVFGIEHKFRVGQ